MITLHDLEEAIAECQGERNPNANTCIKLAAFYTLKNHLFPDAVQSIVPQQAQLPERVAYSNDWKQFPDSGFDYESDTEFAQIAAQADKNVLMRVVDELMTVLETTNPRLYRAVLRKLLDN